MITITAAEEMHTTEVFDLLCELESTKLERKIFDQIFKKNSCNTNIGYFLAQVNNTTVGFISVHLNFLLHHCAAVAEIQELIVTRSHQGQGIGGALLDCAQSWAREKNALQLEVSCNNQRIQAHEFYQGHGFSRSHVKFVRK